MNILRYPLNVSELGSYMNISIHKFDKYSTDKLSNPDKFSHKTIKGKSIALPMPNALSDSTGVIWSSQDVMSTASLVGQKAKEKIQQAGGAVASQQAFLKTSNKSAEKYNALAFDGVNSKTYTFTWILVPESKAEADNIERIIDTLEEASLPSLDGTGQFFNVPDVVKIKFAGKHRFNKMGFLPCVINSVDVDYSPQGNFFVYEDGNVPVVALTINVTEITSRNRSSHTRAKKRAK